MQLACNVEEVSEPNYRSRKRAVFTLNLVNGVANSADSRRACQVEKNGRSTASTWTEPLLHRPCSLALDSNVNRPSFVFSRGPQKQIACLRRGIAVFSTHKWAQEVIECAILLTSLLTKAYRSPLRSRAGPLGAAPSFGAPASRKVWGRHCQSSSRLGHNSGTPRSLRIKQGPNAIIALHICGHS